MESDSVEYWKEKYIDLNAQFDDFQKQSFEFENELETQLKQAETEIKDLQTRNNRLAIDNETLKSKFNDVNTSTHKQISNLQEELAKLKAVKDEMQKYIRELEQKNDNLEQTNRCAMFSLGEFEAKMNEALEQNAILHSEMEEKDDLSETVQRLRDETRDLKQELAVRQKANQSSINLKHNINEQNAVLKNINNNNKTQAMDVTVTSTNDTSKPATLPTTATPPSSQTTLNTILNELNLQQQMNQQTKTKIMPAVRINALNLVSDAMRKITSAESRLITSRNLMKESNRDRRSATISTIIDTSSYNPVNANSTKNNVVANKAANIVASANTTVNVY